MAVPNTEREGISRRRFLDFEIQQLGEIQSVVVFRVKNRGAGFEGIAGDGYSSHTATDDAVSLEYMDFAMVGVLAEEVGDGGAGYAAADYADGGKI